MSTKPGKGRPRRPSVTTDKTAEAIARSQKKLKDLYDRYTVPCPHCGKPILASMFASVAGRRAAAMRKTHAPGTGRPKKMSPCPHCGDLYGAAEMRKHRPACARGK